VKGKGRVADFAPQICVSISDLSKQTAAGRVRNWNEFLGAKRVATDGNEIRSCRAHTRRTSH